MSGELEELLMGKTGIWCQKCYVGPFGKEQRRPASTVSRLITPGLELVS